MRDAARRRQRAVAALFFANGASFSSWFPRIPEVRERLGLSLGELGTVLVGIGLGGLLASVVAGAVVDRIGSRRAAVGALAVQTLGLPALGLASSALLLAVSLATLSAVDALADVGMNVQAAEVQRTSERSLIQRFHAAWSIGTVAGAVVGSACAALDISLTLQLAVTGALLAGLSVSSWPALIPGLRTDDPEAGGGGRLPVVVLLVLTALVVAVVEGTPGDWAAVFADEVHGAASGTAGLGYVAVAAGMVVGRLGGDWATDTLGAPRLLATAISFAAVGLFVVAASPAVAVAIVGFALWGLGVSVLFPTLYLQAASTPGVPPGLGVGLMSSGARLGFLASPPTVGAVSEATSLRVGLAAVVGVALAGSVVLSVATRRATVRRGAGP